MCAKISMSYFWDIVNDWCCELGWCYDGNDVIGRFCLMEIEVWTNTSLLMICLDLWNDNKRED